MSFAFMLVPYGPMQYTTRSMSHELRVYRRDDECWTVLEPSKNLVHALVQHDVKHVIEVRDGQTVISINIPHWERYVTTAYPFVVLQSQVRVMAEYQIAATLAVPTLWLMG